MDDANRAFIVKRGIVKLDSYLQLTLFCAGIAVVSVMSITSTLLVLVMLMIWKTNILIVILYVFTIYLVELLYLTSVLYKFTEGGYLPLALSAFLMIVMSVWNYVYRKKYTF